VLLAAGPASARMRWGELAQLMFCKFWHIPEKQGYINASTPLEQLTIPVATDWFYLSITLYCIIIYLPKTVHNGETDYRIHRAYR
jgi:hypothetical protein